MTDADRLLTWLREVMDVAEGVVRALPSGPWRWEKTGNDGYESLIGADGTYVLSSSDAEGYQSWIDKRPGFDGYLQLMQPAAVLCRIAADRRLLGLHADVAGKCVECSQGYESGDWGPDFPCKTVRLLAESWGWAEGNGG